MTASRNNLIPSADFLKGAELQESTEGLKALLGKFRYLDVPERMTEFELVHGHVVKHGVRMTGWTVTAFELNGVVAGYKGEYKILAQSVSSKQAKVFALMDGDGLVQPGRDVDYDYMAETLLDQSRDIRALTP